MFTPPVEMLSKADPHKGNDKTRILLCKYVGHEEYDNIYPTGEDVEVSGSYPFAMSVQLKSTS